jgi:aspartate 1-decarboxylase
LQNEAVHIWNVTRGTRLTTYAMRGQRHSGIVCINGAAAHLNQPGDLVILATFAEMDDVEARAFEPAVVFVDGRNRIVQVRSEVPGGVRRAGGGRAP